MRRAICIAFGRELSNTVNPMWLLRTLPNNVLGHIGIKYGLKGANACITNHSVGGIARGHRSGGSAAHRRGGPRRRRRTRHADRAADGALLPPAGTARIGRAASVRRPARRQRYSAKARARCCSKPKPPRRARNAPVLGEIPGRRLRLRSARDCSRSATTATASPARLRRRWTMRASRPRTSG